MKYEINYLYNMCRRIGILLNKILLSADEREQNLCRDRLRKKYVRFYMTDDQETNENYSAIKNYMTFLFCTTLYLYSRA